MSHLIRVSDDRRENKEHVQGRDVCTTHDPARQWLGMEGGVLSEVVGKNIFICKPRVAKR